MLHFVRNDEEPFRNCEKGIARRALRNSSWGETIFLISLSDKYWESGKSRHPGRLFIGGNAGLDFLPGIFLKGGHALLNRLLPDFGVVAISMGFLAIFLMAVGIRVLAETIGFDRDVASKIVPSLGLLVLWCAALTAATLKFLATVRRHIDKVASDG